MAACRESSIEIAKTILEDGMARITNRSLAMAAGLALAAHAALPQPASAQASDLARGQQIAEKLCARCHAIGKSGASPDPKAVPFRSIGKLYPLDHLAEAFAEGIVTGDNKMPEFKFEPPDIDAIITYLAAMSAER
jgi:cytochrome c